MARSSAFNTITRDPAAAFGTVSVAAPFDALAAPVNDDLISSALTMLPQGAAWGTPDGEAMPLTHMLARFVRVLIDGFVWLYSRAFRLTREAISQGASELLPEWEADYGLPEACFTGEMTTAQRLVALGRKVRADAVNTPGDFIRLALDYGFEIEIEEPALFECGFSECGGKHTVGSYIEETYWIVRVRDAGISYFECGASECGYDPLFSLGAAEEILCMLRKMAPAWTLPVLEPWINYARLVIEGGRPIVTEYGNHITVALP
ncbi:Mu-like prophage protein [Rhizobium sp. TAL182]|uniref:putative phage tail protein n=1 Tax=Rhizobium sp. TAL182 TaxID=2020313 RepID=UPI000A211862|nr:putative phage tail protein [Rhizobium sp. TAL182]ARO22955.1 Mu-like prophage protein [Rhizobium sp. TAL182]